MWIQGNKEKDTSRKKTIKIRNASQRTNSNGVPNEPAGVLLRVSRNHKEVLKNLEKMKSQCEKKFFADFKTS